MSGAETNDAQLAESMLIPDVSDDRLMASPGRIVVLSGVPRSGKSSIARAVQAASGRPWISLGVDSSMRSTPDHLQPGMGLRPGGEHPELEPFVVTFFLALYDSVVAHSRLGLDAVVDVGHHDDYSRPLAILPAVAQRLRELPAWFVGVRCSLEEIVRRRAAAPDLYAHDDGRGGVPDIVRRWEQAVHDPGVYDLEVDTTSTSPAECAASILDRVVGAGSPTAFARLTAGG